MAPTSKRCTETEVHTIGHGINCYVCGSSTTFDLIKFLRDPTAKNTVLGTWVHKNLDTEDLGDGFGGGIACGVVGHNGQLANLSNKPHKNSGFCVFG